ncbi:MAG: translation initiation factor IF-2, partial [Clostridia bacterium]|nr:translation initiation factor IF-2 [Clostridia bacterium]
MKIRPRKSTSEKQRKQTQQTVVTVIDHAVVTTDMVPIKTLSEKIGKSVAEILKKLLLEFQLFKNINDSIDFDTAELVSAEFGVTLELKKEQSSEEKLFEIHADDAEEDSANLVVRPPIVTIMGHVDHGKTSILDYIRKSNVATGEAGGITQHIGAYTIKIPYEGKDKQITFLDTPGHEAFTAMRARGADVTDIVVLVVAADDGIMPQTVEAINHAKAANVPIIVAVNKMDKVDANPDRVYQQLAEYGLLVESWMGDTIAVPISAKTGMGIPSLLENILVVAELRDLTANPNRSAKGTIVEAKLDKGKGPMATVLVQNGTLHTGDFIVAGTAIGRIRAMFDDKGRKVSTAGPSTPVSIL